VGSSAPSLKSLRLNSIPVEPIYGSRPHKRCKADEMVRRRCVSIDIFRDICTSHLSGFTKYKRCYTLLVSVVLLDNIDTATNYGVSHAHKSKVPNVPCRGHQQWRSVGAPAPATIHRTTDSMLFSTFGEELLPISRMHPFVYKHYWFY
jgi:hypothetical protein